MSGPNGESCGGCYYWDREGVNVKDKVYVSVGHDLSGGIAVFGVYATSEEAHLVFDLNSRPGAVWEMDAPVPDKWRECLEFLAELPYMKGDPGLYGLEDVADWARATLEGGGLTEAEKKSLKHGRIIDEDELKESTPEEVELAYEAKGSKGTPWGKVTQ